MAAAGSDGITIDGIIEKLLQVRGARPGKQVSKKHGRVVLSAMRRPPRVRIVHEPPWASPPGIPTSPSIDHRSAPPSPPRRACRRCS